jgi:hypothetical protein
MSAENLWGEIPKQGNLRTPTAILREQASILGEATNNILVADVVVSKKSNQFVQTFFVVAPALDNYRISILSVTHDMTLYPLSLMSEAGNYQCTNEASFKQALKYILSSPRVHQIVDSLLSQSQAA